MEKFLASLAGTTAKNTKELEDQTNLLQKIYNVQKEQLKVEEDILKEDKRKEQKTKRSKADRKGPLDFLKKEEKNAKKKGGIFGGIFDTIKNLVMGLGGIGILKALGLTAIGAYFGSPEFRNFVNTTILEPAWGIIKEGLIGPKGLFGSENQKKAWEWMKENPLKSLGLAVGGIVALIGPGSALMLAFKGLGALLSTLPFLKGAGLATAATTATTAATTAAGGATAAAGGVGIGGMLAGATGLVATPLLLAGGAGLAGNEIVKGRYGGGEAGDVGLSLYQEEMALDASKTNNRGRKVKDFTPEETTRKAEIRKIREELVRIKEERDKARKEAVRFSGSGRSKKKIIDPEKMAAANAAYDAAFAAAKEKYGFQTGGFVGRVPNQGGNGDRFRTMVDAGSVVLNQTASGYQSGGKVPVMLEQGEHVFGPKDPMAGAALLMNSMIPRFQEGGTVTHKSSGSDGVLSSLSSIGESIGGIFSSIFEGVSGIMKPFLSMLGSLVSMGGTGGGSMGMGMLGQGFTPYSPTPASTSGGYSGSSISGNSLLDFIASGEGGYNSMNQGTQGNSIVGSTHDASGILGKSLTSMTIGEVMKRQAYLMNSSNPQSSDYGIFAAGRYQIIPSTMKEILPQSGLTKDDMFSQENQDKLGVTLITKKQPRVADYLKGNGSLHGAMDALSNEFASIPDPTTGRSKYGSGNASGHSVAEVQRALMTAKQENKMQLGGVANMRGQSNRVTAQKSVEEFIKQISSSNKPIIVPMPMGGGGKPTETVPQPGTQTEFPTLPSSSSSIVAMEYKYRITMGASV